MGVTKIEWADYTFNPWIGCSKVSAGCAHCYAERDFAIRRRRVIWGPGGTRDRTSTDYWRQPLKWDRQAASVADAASIGSADAGSVHHVRPRVFCASLADVFEAGRPELVNWRADLLRLIERTPNLDWLLLTKRLENVLPMVNELAESRYNCMVIAAKWRAGEPPANVWLGTSIENQATADRRIPELLQIPAAVRFLSVEPLLGPIQLWNFLTVWCRYHQCMEPFNGLGSMDTSQPCFRWQANTWDMIDWMIVGGESGPQARPMHPEWARSIRDQCQAAGVPFFFKQWGEFVPEGQDDTAPQGMQADVEVVYADQHDREPEAVFRIGKRFAGRRLDGREWNELPVLRAVAHG